MSDINDIIEKQNYLTPSRYLSGRIVEYDIKSANISVLREQNIITDQDYQYLKNLPKINREIEIGLREKADPSLYTEIQKGIKDAKKCLANFNQLEEDQIVRIANDAVYINSNKDLEYTQFGEYVEFKQKSEFDVYCNLCSVLIFCRFLDDGNIDVDIKGIGNNMVVHQDYMVYSIVSTITLLERSGVEDAISYLSEICEEYVNRRLPIGYYREFNSSSIFRMPYNSEFGFRDFGITNVYDADKHILDINYNYTILRELWSILVEIYSIRKR